MRRLLLVLLLAGCQMAAPAGPVGIVDEAIEVTALPTETLGATPEVALPTAATALPTEAAGADDAVAPPTEELATEELAPEEVVPVISAAQASCERGGGTWAKVGSLGRICVKQTGQGAKSCDRKSDCKGECLAQSGTCSPIAPLMGCNDVLDGTGRRMTQCLQ